MKDDVDDKMLEAARTGPEEAAAARRALESLVGAPTEAPRELTKEEKKAARIARLTAATMVRVKRRRRRNDPVAGAWRLWCHDFDTLLHELVKNEALADREPGELVARAEAFADAIEAMQNRRRPPTLEREDDWR